MSSGKESNITDGARNARLFLMGMFIYVMIYIYLKNIQLSGTIQEQFYDSIKVGLYILFIADICVMGYIYKNHYGRSITNEVGEVIHDKQSTEFDYDETKHKYIKKTKNNKSKEEKSISIFKKDKVSVSKEEKLLVSNDVKKLENDELQNNLPRFEEYQSEEQKLNKINDDNKPC